MNKLGNVLIGLFCVSLSVPCFAQDETITEISITKTTEDENNTETEINSETIPPIDPAATPIVEATTIVVDATIDAAPPLWNTTKDVVNTLGSQYEGVYDFTDGDWFQGISASLYDLTSHDIHLGSLRLGYGVDFKAYGGVSANLPGLADRYVPESWKTWTNWGPLDTAWDLVGTYAALGFIGGYDFDEGDPVVGVTVGGKIVF